MTNNDTSLISPTNPTRLFCHYLHQLKIILAKIEAHSGSSVDTNNGKVALLQQSLQPGMLPLIAQIRTAVNFSLRACCPLSNRPRINFDNASETYAGLQQQLDETIAYLQAIPEADFKQGPNRITDTAGFRTLDLSREEYLNCYALPNFFFHINMAYAIARAAGVPLSKGDFDGYHQYPDGFSFVEK